MFKKMSIPILVLIYIFVVWAYEFYKNTRKESERVAFCSANEAEYKKCGIDEKGKEITPYRVICRKQANEITELNIKKLERKMDILKNKYNICNEEVRNFRVFGMRQVNNILEWQNILDSKNAQCDELAAEYNNLKDERKILIKKREVSQEYVENNKNLCSFDLERYRIDCLRRTMNSDAKAGYGLVEPCLGLYGSDEITYLEP